MGAPAQFLMRYMVCECVDGGNVLRCPAGSLFGGGVYDVVSAYPLRLCVGFYWVKEYTRGFIPCARRWVCSVHEPPYSDRFS